jgi:hypothetical protein
MTNSGMLFGWESGHKVYRAVYKKLQHLPKNAVLFVDFRRVRQASYQALKEVMMVFQVLRTSKFEGRYIVLQLEASNHDLVESVEVVARLGGHHVPLIDKGGSLRHFGKLTRAESDTLEFIERHGELTSKELRGQLGLLPSAASNRLRRLHHLRLIRREERAVPGSGGREFVYEPLLPRRAGGGGATRRAQPKREARRGG